jgi:hypothetical protein
MLGNGRREEGSGLERKAMTMFLDLLFRSLFGNGRWGRKAVGRGWESLSDFSVMGSEIGWRWTTIGDEDGYCGHDHRNGGRDDNEEEEGDQQL